MAKGFWPRWLGWLFGRDRNTRRKIPKQDTLARRLDSAVRGNKERDLLRGAEESLRRGRREEAVRAYGAALEVFMDRGAYQKAIAVLTTLTRLEPQVPAHFERLAEVQEQLGRRPEAELARRQAAALLEASGAHTRAMSVMSPPQSQAAPAPGLHVERVRSTPVAPAPAPAAAAPAPKGVPPAVSEVGPLDLGPLDDDPEDDERPRTLPPEHLVPDGGDRTLAMPAIVRAPPAEPPLPAFEPLAPGVPPADTDPSEVFGARTQALSSDETGGLDLPDPDELSLSPFPAAPDEDEDEDEDVDDPDDAGDQTLYDPGFVAAHLPKAPPSAGARTDATTGRPRGLALPVTEAPTPSRPARARGPRGLAIPGASTVLDPRGPSALSGASREGARPSSGERRGGSGSPEAPSGGEDSSSR